MAEINNYFVRRNVMKQKLIALLLAAVSVICVFVSCKHETGTSSKNTDDTKDSNGSTEVQNSETELLMPDLPDVTYGGYDFRFYSWNIDGWRVYDDIFVEDPTGKDSISQKVYERNSRIEDKYDITISETREYYSKYAYMIQQNTLAGEDYADVLVSHGWIIPAIYASNPFYNLKDINYLEFDMPWWDDNATESLTIEGFLPTGVSDLTLLDKSATYVIFYNLSLADELKITENLYSVVDNGDWTQEKLRTIGLTASKDIDGDGNISTYGVDRYGIIGNDSAVTALFGGIGGRYVSLDEEGSPYISFDTQRNISAIQDFLERILFDETLFCNTSWVDGFTDVDSLANLFMQDLGLFYVRVLEEGEKLRNMESEYAILPIPKYDAEQAEYYCPVSVYSNNLISVPYHAENTDRTGVIIEALSAESYYSVKPEFFDVVLDNKIARDDESKKMLDIIFNSRLYDLGEFYGLAYFSDKMRGVTGHSYDQTGIAQTSDIASFYATYKPALEDALNSLIKVVDDWNAQAG